MSAFKAALALVAKADGEFSAGRKDAAFTSYDVATRALEPFVAAAPKAAARAHLRRGICAQKLGESEAALASFGRSFDIAKAGGLTIHRAEPARLLAAVKEQRGDLDEAERWLLEALQAYGQGEAVAGTITVLNALGRVARGRDDFGRALERFEQAERLASAEGYMPGRVDALSNLGNLHRVQSDLTGAQAAFEGVLAVAKENENSVLKARAHTDLGNVAAAALDVEAATSHYGQARALQGRLGDIVGVASNDCNLASLSLQAGRIVEAIEAYRAALQVVRQQGRARMAVDVATMLAHAQRRSGDTANSAKVLEAALIDAQKLDYGAGELRIEAMLAGHALAQGDVIQARRRNAGLVAALRNSQRPSDEVSGLFAAIAADMAGDALEAAESRLERVEHLVLTRGIVRHQPTLHATVVALAARRLAGRDDAGAAEMLTEAASRQHVEGNVLEALGMRLGAADYQIPNDLDGLVAEAVRFGAAGAEYEARSLIAVVDAAPVATFVGLIDTAEALGLLALSARIRRRQAECHMPEELHELATAARARGALWEARLCEGLTQR